MDPHRVPATVAVADLALLHPYIIDDRRDEFLHLGHIDGQA